ncbi:P-loop containing nucleoside triphosphate hydrolase protein [Mycena sanguinolenta]|uniref:P-loop containing nucleoside triphosphate hydrolase protein n=1 Tax=Mycena sanguinolenta TaxID=230812 RepID=A0A8H6Z5V4_9AGAR|nr:P-loop containing nucleoside triphosphate hydrolase protein [Mycena sanguinolenta]
MTTTNTPMHPLPVKPLQPGLVNLPGATPASATLVAELLHKDYVGHHCFYNDRHHTNHLSHHVLSLHDLGASPECIQAMFDQEAATQRALHHGKVEPKADGITETNWTRHLGDANAHMYSDYLEFFSSAIAKHGVSRVLEHYVFSPEANGNGTLMLARFVGGLVHPFIQAGFGIEFGQDFMVAQGLAQAAVTEPEGASVMDTSTTRRASSLCPTPQTASPPRRLDPARSAALRAIYAKWTFDLHDAADLPAKIAQCMWQAALLLGATGKAGRKPRMDFYLMHFLTSALFLRVVVDALAQPLHKAQLLQAYARMVAFFVLLRGRPRIDCALAMAYPAHPVPRTGRDAGGAALGALGGSSAWLPLLNNAGLHPEAHVVKTIRALFYCAQRYGNTPAGAVVGAVDADGKETHEGAAGLDGTLFIRVAGVLTSALGWVAHGDQEGSWDSSGLGWEEAWSKEDE